MSADVNRISIAIRELGEGGIWRCGVDQPRPAAILMCDIRRGRTAEHRAELARQLVAACIEILGLREDNLNLEFTQHAGDEMYHTMYGGFSDEWSPEGPDRLGADCCERSIMPCIGLVLTPGFQLMAFAATSVFEYANVAPRAEGPPSCSEPNPAPLDLRLRPCLRTVSPRGLPRSEFVLGRNRTSRFRREFAVDARRSEAAEHTGRCPRDLERDLLHTRGPAARATLFDSIQQGPICH